MKQARSRTIVLVTVVAGLSIADGCQQDRQMIFTAPRSLATSARKSNEVGKLDPSTENSLPAPRPLTPSNGVDVPIINPD
jgi:hypothetical protein